MKRIQNLSQWFKVFFQLVMVIQPLLLVLFWIQAPVPLLKIITHKVVVISYIPTYIDMMHRLTALTKLYGFLTCLIPLSVTLYVLYTLISLFKQYEKGIIFSFGTVRCYRQVGYGLLVGQLLAPVYQLLLSLVLTWHNPPGYRNMTMVFTGVNIGVLLIALMIIFLSWIMKEGLKIKEEQAYTI